MFAPLLPVAGLLRVSDSVFARAIAGVSEELARQPMDAGNRFLWVAAHATAARGRVARILGAASDVPWEAAFDRGTEPPTDPAAWPSLEAVAAKWSEVSARLHERLDTLGEADLAKPVGEFPSTDGTLLGAIGLLAFHDAYHLGQLGHLRRRLGLSRVVG